LKLLEDGETMELEFACGARVTVHRSVAGYHITVHDTNPAASSWNGPDDEIEDWDENYGVPLEHRNYTFFVMEKSLVGIAQLARALALNAA
jgi:hypothetical protein